MATALRLALPAADLAALRERVRRLAGPRPGVYRMVDHQGRVLYVGKARRLRDRLLSYFRARFPDDKAARILHAAADIVWDYAPSEFGAHLLELRQIARHRPPFNWHLNRTRRTLFITVSGGPAPRLATGSAAAGPDARWYGPFVAPARVREAIRVLNDLLGLRDCAPAMPMVFAAQGDLFEPAQPAACSRHELGLCSGPCAGLVSAADYAHRVEAAVDFLEGRRLAPLDRVVEEMQATAERGEFERAVRWRDRFERLEWLLAATSRARAAVQALAFVYRDRGESGEDRAHVIRHGLVRASYPWPETPIEREAFRAVVREELARPAPPPAPVPFQHLDELLLLLSWFRRHPEAWRNTSRLESWVA